MFICRFSKNTLLLLVVIFGAHSTSFAFDDRIISLGPGDDLQQAVDNLEPGQTIQLAPGRYYQSIVIHKKGTPEKPIRILGGKGVVFCGLNELKLEWNEIRRGVYQTKVTQPVRQLFVNQVMMTPARWPNMSWNERWENSKWPKAEADSSYGTLVDSNLASSNLDFTGCVAILNIGSWQTFRRVITKHQKGRDRFNYKTDPNSRLVKVSHPAEIDRYCIYGEAALDAPGEWFYDDASQALTLYPPEGRNPRQLMIESKGNPTGILCQDCAYLTVSGIQFRGTTVRMKNVNHCQLENIHIEFGSAISNPFGPNTPLSDELNSSFNARKWFGETSVDVLTEVFGNDNVIRNVVCKYSEGPGLTVGGKRNLIENCLFQDIDWHGLDYGFGIDLLAAAPVTVRYVTLDHSGGSEGLRLANHGASLVEFCHLHHCGLRQSDGAIIQTSGASSAGTEIRYNWVHDHQAFHWGGNGIRGDDGARRLQIHHNVVWNCREKGIVTKGDGHSIYNNTCFNNSKIDILVPRNRLPQKTKELVKQNINTRVFNNLSGVSGSWYWENPKLPPYGLSENNRALVLSELRDIRSFDFRPTKRMNGTDAGQDKPTANSSNRPISMGAYDFDQPKPAVGYQRRN